MKIEPLLLQRATAIHPLSASPLATADGTLTARGEQQIASFAREVLREYSASPVRRQDLSPGLRGMLPGLESMGGLVDDILRDPATRREFAA